MATAQGLFVTGTDTGVGKSVIACAIICLLREHGVDAVGFKPVATGVAAGIWSDAVLLHEASGKCEPIEKICPLRFNLPLAPTLAARVEGVEPDMDIARGVLARFCERHATVVIEGTGGILSPLDRKTLVADFAAQVGFPVLVVCKAGLGTISQTLLTLREIERSKMDVAGIIMNTTNWADTPLAIGAKEEIERISGNKVVAIVPHMRSDDVHDPRHSQLVARIIASLVQQIDVRTMLGSEGTRNKASSRFRRRRASD